MSISKKRRNWTKQDDTELIKYYDNSKESIEFLSIKLGFTKPTIKRKASFLGVAKKRNSWNTKDDDFIKNHYPEKGAEYCSEQLGRTKHSIAARASRLKVKISSSWNKHEIKQLKKNYSKCGAKKLNTTIFKHKKVTAIMDMANRLGLKVNTKISNSYIKNHEDLSHFFDIKDPFIAYLLGFLWADGTVSPKTNNVRLKIVNEDFIDIKDRVFMLAKSWRFRVDDDGHPNHKEQAVLEINHKKLRDFLAENDYLIKSGASADKILSKIPEHLQHYWWRGYFDGDGSFVISHGTHRMNITSCWNQNWKFAEKLCKQLNIGFRISIRKQGKARNSTINFENETYLRRFAEYIYQGESFGLKRKFQKYQDYLTIKKNVRPNKTSQYKGVCFDKRRNVWMMQIYKNKPYRILCKTELQAAKLYDKFARKLQGNKAILNFPNE